jgi:uncharacterized protein YdeI (YjbR/CyaY-like superfamily)
MPTPKSIKYFRTPADLRSWFDKNHATKREQWIGYYKKDSGTPCITWPESVDQALCFGWIDGVRKSVDDKRYTIRFTPRRATSIWSAINIKRVKELTKLGLMKREGLKVFEQRDGKKSNRYSFEQRKNPVLPSLYEKQFKSHKNAWIFFSSQPPWFRRASVWWIISAKQEKTKMQRLERLIQDSEKGISIPAPRRKKT